MGSSPEEKLACLQYARDACGSADGDRPDMDVLELESLTLDELIQFFEQHFLAGGKLISHSHREHSEEISLGRPKDVSRQSVSEASEREVQTVQQFQGL
jgi:hypothetical protein